MKLKKISAMCSKSKTYHILDKTDAGGHITQWMGDGSAFYQLAGLPTLDEEGLCKLFDIAPNNRDKFDIAHRDMPLDVSDSNPLDSPVENMGMSLFCHGKELIPLRAKDGILFIQRQYLRPMADEADLIELYEREAAGIRYIVAKAGMFIQAVILPINVLNKAFVNLLGDIHKECKAELERTQCGDDESDGPFQPSWIQESGDRPEP